jgi:hypothetical protein
LDLSIVRTRARRQRAPPRGGGALPGVPFASAPTAALRSSPLFRRKEAGRGLPGGATSTTADRIVHTISSPWRCPRHARRRGFLLFTCKATLGNSSHASSSCWGCDGLFPRVSLATIGCSPSLAMRFHACKDTSLFNGGFRRRVSVNSFKN